MSFDSLLIHPMVAVRQPVSHDTADLDDYGQPTADGAVVVTPFRARVYARSMAEMALQPEGAGRSTHIIRARDFDLLGVDYIAHADPADPTQADAADDRRYQVTAVERRNGRTGVHHVAIEAVLVTATPGAQTAA